MEPTLTPQDIDIMRKVKQNGGSLLDAKLAVSANREGRQSPLLTKDLFHQPKKIGFIEDTIGDIGGLVDSTIRTFDERSDVVAESMRNTYVPFLNPEGRQGAVETAGQIVSQGVLAAGDTLFNTAVTAFKVPMPEEMEQSIKESIASGMQTVMEMPGVKDMTEWFGGLDPRTKRNLAIPAALLELVGVAKESKLGAEARQAMKVADTATDVVSPAVRAAERTVTMSDRVRNLLPRELRYQLSDIPESAENAIKRSNEANISKHAQIARDAMKETTNKTNIEYVGELAEDAYKKIQTRMGEVGAQKSAALNEYGSLKLQGTLSGDMIDAVQKGAGERFGVVVNADGTVSGLAGRVSSLDPVSEKFLAEYVNKLRGLGMKPTVRQVDDFVDWAQQRLYKQSKSYSQLDAADKPLVEFLKQQTGEMNTALKNDTALKGVNYADLNAEYSRLIEMSDELSRGLGADGRKGGAFVKRVFSPSDARTKELFVEIANETGIDLADEATLAKFFMDSVGDTRQNTLLKEVMEIADSSSNVNIMEPGTWVKWLRENADMDGEELAREILRRTKEAENAGQVPKGTSAAVIQAAEQQGLSLTQSSPARQVVSSTNDTQLANKTYLSRLVRGTEDEFAKLADEAKGYDNVDDFVAAKSGGDFHEDTLRVAYYQANPKSLKEKIQDGWLYKTVSKLFDSNDLPNKEGGFVKNPFVNDTLKGYKPSSPRGRNLDLEAKRALASNVVRGGDTTDARELIRAYLAGDNKITRSELATAIDIIEGNATKK